ncbi:transglycosylase family protein [Streptomyces sp. NPDC101225]|uniref:LysM peptidoglycan-binding domain-containing protein n=1 Tax=Streptomyces sp. NPDC101225 TaxID=3366135 RepID=UPI00381E2810
MLSGNGRHRRPRQAPALVVAAGVTGSAIALPLLAASGASAADGGGTWDKVAQCETGGAWSQNSGDGRYGGLQLTQDDWDAYGGLDYATRPDLASRNQQIAVAQKVLADRGVGAFHTCGLTTGLSKESDAADIDTGVPGGGDDSSGSGSSGSSFGLSNSSGTSSSDSSGESSSSDSSDGSLLDSSSGPSPSASTGKADNSPESTASASPSGSASRRAPSAAREGGTSPAERAKGDDSDNSEQSAGSWSLVDTGALGGGRHRGASADETGADGHAAGTYTVRAGDTLASIADSRDVSGGWRALYDENKKAIGDDPNRIAAGQTLRLGGE